MNEIFKNEIRYDDDVYRYIASVVQMQCVVLYKHIMKHLSNYINEDGSMNYGYHDKLIGVHADDLFIERNCLGWNAVSRLKLKKLVGMHDGVWNESQVRIKHSMLYGMEEFEGDMAQVFDFMKMNVMKNNVEPDGYMFYAWRQNVIWQYDVQGRAAGSDFVDVCKREFLASFKFFDFFRLMACFQVQDYFWVLRAIADSNFLDNMAKIEYS